MSSKVQFPNQSVQNIFVQAAVDVQDDGESLAGELVRMAATELERGNVKHAEHYLQQGLATDPQDHRCHAYLAVCEAMRNPESRSAENLARTLVANHPKDPIVHFAMGQVFLLKSRRRDAFRLFNRAHRLAEQEKSLQQQVNRAEPRKPSVFPSLSRNHPLNVFAGRLRAIFTRSRRPK